MGAVVYSDTPIVRANTGDTCISRFTLLKQGTSDPVLYYMVGKNYIRSITTISAKGPDAPAEQYELGLKIETNHFASIKVYADNHLVGHIENADSNHLYLFSNPGFILRPNLQGCTRLIRVEVTQYEEKGISPNEELEAVSTEVKEISIVEP